MKPIQVDASQFRPLMPTASLILLEKIHGWKWWSYLATQRNADGKREKLRVRTLRDPDFPNDRWKRWGAEPDVQLRMADGNEPLMRIEGTGDAMSLPIYPYLEGDDGDAAEMLTLIAKAGWRVSATFGSKQVAVVLSCATTMIAGHGERLAHAACEAAMLLPNDWKLKARI